MHMSDALLSVEVGASMTVVAATAIGYSIKRIKINEYEEHKIPMMGVMGAFVFAAQMINFTIPGTGSSGHIGGGILLAALLGPFPALITLASVLLIQSLFFADGGLLALGCNIFNMGVIPCLFVYPLIYKPILKKAVTVKRITTASVLTVVIGLQLGAFCVVLETFLSKVTELPVQKFLLFMQPIHLAIGIGEGFITAAVLCFIYNIRKDLIENVLNGQKVSSGKVPIVRVLACFAIFTVLLGGVVSLYASTKPDGLEWSVEETAGTMEIKKDSRTHEIMQEVQEKTAILPDYELKQTTDTDSFPGTSLSGILGGMITLGVILLTGIAILGYKKLRNSRMLMKE